MRPRIKAQILSLLERDKEVRGTFELAIRTNCLNLKSIMLTYVWELLEEGEISVDRSSGGRGHRTIYRRNRNQPGLPRKVHHS